MDADFSMTTRYAHLGDGCFPSGIIHLIRHIWEEGSSLLHALGEDEDVHVLLDLGEDEVDVVFADVGLVGEAGVGVATEGDAAAVAVGFPLVGDREFVDLLVHQLRHFPLVGILDGDGSAAVEFLLGIGAGPEEFRVFELVASECGIEHGFQDRGVIAEFAEVWGPGGGCGRAATDEGGEDDRGDEGFP